jgi:hypothetical protein
MSLFCFCLPIFCRPWSVADECDRPHSLRSVSPTDLNPSSSSHRQQNDRPAKRSPNDTPPHATPTQAMPDVSPQLPTLVVPRPPQYQTDEGAQGTSGGRKKQKDDVFDAHVPGEKPSNTRPCLHAGRRRAAVRAHDKRGRAARAPSHPKQTRADDCPLSVFDYHLLRLPRCSQ